MVMGQNGIEKEKHKVKPAVDNTRLALEGYCFCLLTTTNRKGGHFTRETTTTTNIISLQLLRWFHILSQV